MCDKYIDNISLYIDDMLDTDEALDLKDHMSTCEDCQKIYNNMLAVKEMIDNMDDVELPTDLHSNIMNAVENAMSDQPKKEDKVIKVNFKKYTAIVASIVALLFVFSPVISNSLYNNEPQVTLMADPVSAKDEIRLLRNREYVAKTVSVLVQTDDIELAKSDIIASMDSYDNYSEYTNDSVTQLIIQLDDEPAIALLDYITTSYPNSEYVEKGESLSEDIQKLDEELNEKFNTLDTAILTDEQKTEVNNEIDKIVDNKNELFKKSDFVTVNITIKN